MMENMRPMVQEERRAARNLVAFHVDLSAPQPGKVLTRKPPSSPRLSTECKHRLTKHIAKAGARVRSASTGRDKKSELQARYWAFLFGNLQRAVDEIYQTCEMDESVSECKEAILVLENFTRDFHNLIEWFKLKWEYENTPLPERPTSLAWEVRKSSPGRFQLPSKMPATDYDSPAKRNLDFSESERNELEGRRLGLLFGDVIFEKHSQEPSAKMINLIKTESADPNVVDVSNVGVPEEVSNAAIATVVEEVTAQDERKPLIGKDLDKTDREGVKELGNVENTVSTFCNKHGVESEVTPVLNICEDRIHEPAVDCKDTNVAMVDQASQTVDCPLSSLAQTREVQPKKPSISVLMTAKTSLNKSISAGTGIPPGKNVSAASFVPGRRLPLPLSPTALNPTRGIVAPCMGPGRNVSATLFVPNKKMNTANSTKTCLLPTNGGQEKSPSSAAPRSAGNLIGNMSRHGSNKSIVLSSSLKCRNDTFIKQSPDDIDNMNSETAADKLPTETNATATSVSNIVNSNHIAEVNITSLENTVPSSADDGLIKEPNSEMEVDKGTCEKNVVGTAVSKIAVKRSYQIGTTTPAAEGVEIANSNCNATVTSVSNIEPSDSKQVAMEVKSNDLKMSSLQTMTHKNVTDNCGCHKESKKAVLIDPSSGVKAGPTGDVSISNASDLNKDSTVGTRPKAVLEGQVKGGCSLKENRSTEAKEKSRTEGSAVPTIDKLLNKAAFPPLSASVGLNMARQGSTVKYVESEKTQRNLGNTAPRTTCVSEPNANRYTNRLIRSHTAIEMRARTNKPLQMNRRVIVAGPAKLPAGTRTNLSATPLPARPKSGKMQHEPKIKDLSSGKDEEGWEMVKGRSRWRCNPLSLSSGNIKSRAALRYSLPSPATSLPALSIALDAADSDENSSTPAVKVQSHNLRSPEQLGKQKKDRQNAEIAKRQNTPAKNGKTTEIALAKERSTAFVEKPCTSSNVCVTATDCKEVRNKAVILDLEDQMLSEAALIKSMEQLYKEEVMLTKEIHALESSEIEMDTETDETETDGEATAGLEEEDGEQKPCGKSRSLLETKYQTMLQGMSWADQMDTLDKLEALMAEDNGSKGLCWTEHLSTLEQLEELVLRAPGRALELHQKLSSPSRRRTLPDTIRRHHQRQARASFRRQQLLQDKTSRMRELLNKVGEVKAAQSQLVDRRRARIEEKLKRAEEKRNLHLRSVRRKAHDEEEKLREIAFINELEAQNRRHDFMALCQEQEERLQGIIEERQKKLEEKAAKEAAVEERRRIIEAERQEKIEKMQERRRIREERIFTEQQEKEKERIELAREKARDREERMQALQAAQLATVEELQKKIQQKQEESARRHNQNIELIRQRALETGAASRSVDDQRTAFCAQCLINYEGDFCFQCENPAKGGKWEEMAAKALDKESKAQKKRCKKIRARMSQRGEEYLNGLLLCDLKKLQSPGKTRLTKCLKEAEKLLTNQGIGQWPNNAVTLLERSLAEINRILKIKNAEDQDVFREANGFRILSSLLNLALDIPKNMSPYLPPKCFVTMCTTFSLACTGHIQNSQFVLLANQILLVLDLLLNRFQALLPRDNEFSDSKPLPVDPVAESLMQLVSLILSQASGDNTTKDDLASRIQDAISYIVSVGLVDKLGNYCAAVKEPLDQEPATANFLTAAIQLVTTLATQSCCGGHECWGRLGSKLRATELVGAVSMLYGTLLHHNAPPRHHAHQLAPHTAVLARATLALLATVATTDLRIFQTVVGSETISLQFRHIASYLLWHSAHDDMDTPLLHQVVEAVGFFAVKHRNNQNTLQSGCMPTVLQQLCGLPFEYFSDPRLSAVLYPTLLACCHDNPDNRKILEQELNYQLLLDFLELEAAQSNVLVKLLSATPAPHKKTTPG